MSSSKKNYPPLSLVKKNPKTASVISKLIAPRDRPSYSQLGKNTEYILDQTQLSNISQSISQRVIDADNIFQLFPDIELAAQILISSILSPKDMVSNNLMYKTNKEDIPVDVSMAIMKIIETNMDSQYSLKDNLPKILRGMLFISGAYAEAIIPESSVDQLINSPDRLSTEDLSEINKWTNNAGTLGFLGSLSGGSSGNRFGLENLESVISPTYNTDIHIKDPNSDSWSVAEALKGKISITDDYRLLKVPQLLSKARKDKIAETIASMSSRNNVATEASGEKLLSNRDFSSLLYKGNKGGARPFVTVPTNDQTIRNSVARPLAVVFPTESIIPIYTPGDVTNHIGYFILLDGEGHPITKAILTAALSGATTPLGDQSATMSSLLLTRAKQNLKDTTSADMTLDKQSEIYADIVEADLMQRLKKGIYGESVGIARNNDVYRIMLARSFANQYTRLLYVPRELMTYFAFNHYDNGIGKSLIDDLRVMLSLRAIILFAKVMALTKNSIAMTHVNMVLDPEDPDPQKTIELSIHEIIRMRQQYFPLGINSPVDLVDWIQRAGVDFTFEGHPGLPSTKFEFENKNMQFQVPDSELDELLRKQTYMALGLSPETVDNGFNSEFATTVISNNILLSKRILVYQEKFTKIITEHVKKIIHNDPFIKDIIIKKLKENVESIKKYISEKDNKDLIENEDAFIERYYVDFLDKFESYLPKPDITTNETQTTAFTQYEESLEKTLESWISSDFINTTVAGDLGNNVDLLKATFKAYFLRKWMADNGFMNELGDIIATDKDGNPILDLYQVSKEHLDGIIRSATQFIKSMQPMVQAADKDLAGIDGSGSSSPDASSTDASSGMDDGMGGGMDFGSDNMNDDLLNGDKDATKVEDDKATLDADKSDADKVKADEDEVKANKVIDEPNKDTDNT